jgi:hypothetical protein
MLDFLFHRKRDDVKRVLHGRVNRAHAKTISVADLRSATRGTYTEVVWVIPAFSPTDADYSRVIPAVSHDLSTEGIGIILNAPIASPCVIIGLRDEGSPRFIACKPKHCTPLGYGFYHLGLRAEEVIQPNAEDIEAMCTALERYDTPMESRDRVTIAR